MIVHVYENDEAIGEAAAALFASQIIAKPNSVLGLATGSSPVLTYRRMVEYYRNGAVDFFGVTTFNLDEYVGLDHQNEQSYYYFMHQNLFSGLNIPENRIHVLSGTAVDPQEECRAYDRAIEVHGGIDLQILGIGRNGHIAFNEPSDAFPVATHLVNLTESTIEANRRFFTGADDVPRQALTMGIGSIMKAKSIVIIATGFNKAEAVKAMITGPVTPHCPASILQMHPHVTVMLDRESARLLNKNADDSCTQ